MCLFTCYSRQNYGLTLVITVPAVPSGLTSLLLFLYIYWFVHCLLSVSAFPWKCELHESVRDSHVYFFVTPHPDSDKLASRAPAAFIIVRFLSATVNKRRSTEDVRFILATPGHGVTPTNLSLLVLHEHFIHVKAAIMYMKLRTTGELLIRLSSL